MAETQPTLVPTADPTRLHRLIAMLSGLVVILAFYGLDETHSTLSYGFVNVFSYSVPGEAYFWVAHALLVMPAAMLIGWGAVPWLAPRMSRVATRIDALDRRERVASVGLMVLLGACAARFTRAWYLYDTWVTDDEHAVRFGAQLLASGRAKVEVPPLYEHMPQLFDYADGTWVTSMDWPGGQAVMALGEVGFGAWPHAVIATFPMVAAAIVLGRRLGPRWGALGALFCLMAPMGFTLSMTLHPHLVSRGFVALTLAGFGWGMLDLSRGEAPGKAVWVATGFALGAALISRPFESGSILFPLSVWLTIRAVRDAQHRKAWLLLVAGMVLPLVFFAWHNAAITGKPWLPARWSGTEQYNAHITQGGFIPDSFELLWNRLGANLGYNLMMLLTWFLGPLGLVLAALGVTANRFTQLVTAGLVLGFGIALMHDIHGVHHVGPIHYSEALTPMAILATYGTCRVAFWLRAREVSFAATGTVLVVGVVLGLGIFNQWHGSMMQRSAQIHVTMAEALERADTPRCVLLVPNYTLLWRQYPKFRDAGSWVLQWRHNSPDLDDHQLILHDNPGVAELAAEAYPDREILRLSLVKGKLTVLPALGP